MACAALSVGCDLAELPAADQIVQVYDARTGAWAEQVGADLEPGDTFVDDGHVLRVTDDGVELRGPAALADLVEADATWNAEVAHRAPSLEDWVLVLGDGDDAGHWRLSQVDAGERFAFGGRVYDTADVDDDRVLEIRATELVLSRVVQTMERPSDAVIDAEIAYDDGTVDVITGTPEHPFWVPALQAWVPLGELAVGTALHVDTGAGALLVSATWRQGEVTVYNVEVAGTHNYFVRAEGSDAGAVLVHNSCVKTIGLALDQDLHRLAGTGAVTYKNGGWQRLGVTARDFLRSVMDNHYFRGTFREAAAKADQIVFDVTSFNPKHATPGITNFEFDTIVGDPSLLKKTTFRADGNDVRWNGVGFDPVVSAP